jgi:hypothetical protein
MVKSGAKKGAKTFAAIRTMLDAICDIRSRALLNLLTETY